MTKVKIIGAGSIGNHLSHAARRLGWAVDLCDTDENALLRTREQIYPGRYGAWDQEIRMFPSAEAPRGGYDYIFVGTPPDSHIDLALEAINEAPRALMIEKPLCTPDLRGAQDLLERAKESGVASFVGYDHVVGRGVGKLVELMGCVGPVLSIDVEFREHWGGILNAHPWLEGPWSSYLAYWRRGGGASGEHSHALNLWQHLAQAAGQGRVVAVHAMLDYVEDGRMDYDRLCCLDLATERGLKGRVVQDTITRPPRKWARVQGDSGFLEWHYDIGGGREGVITGDHGGETQRYVFAKSRPDDFIAELRHVEAAEDTGSPISVERGLDTMLVIAAAHRSAAKGRRVTIDYRRGYHPEALAEG